VPARGGERHNSAIETLPGGRLLADVASRASGAGTSRRAPWSDPL